MTYEQPLVIASKPVGIVGIKHGVTEVSLSDGRIVRLTVHVEGLKPVADKIDIACCIVTEVAPLDAPEIFAVAANDMVRRIAAEADGALSRYRGERSIRGIRFQQPGVTFAALL